MAGLTVPEAKDCARAAAIGLEYKLPRPMQEFSIQRQVDEAVDKMMVRGDVSGGANKEWPERERGMARGSGSHAHGLRLCPSMLTVSAAVLLFVTKPLQEAEPSPPPPYPPPPAPPPPALPDTTSDAEQLGRKAGLRVGTQESAGRTSFQITPGMAVVLWLVLVGVFLLLLPHVFRQKRARSGQRSD